MPDVGDRVRFASRKVDEAPREGGAPFCAPQGRAPNAYPIVVDPGRCHIPLFRLRPQELIGCRRPKVARTARPALCPDDDSCRARIPVDLSPQAIEKYRYSVCVLFVLAFWSVRIMATSPSRIPPRFPLPTPRGELGRPRPLGHRLLRQ